MRPCTCPRSPSLGITDPYELTQAQFDASVALLKDQRSKLIGKYWGTYGENIDDFQQGVVVDRHDLAVPGDVLKAEDSGVTVEAVLPSRRRDRLGRHLDARQGRQASELHAAVDGLDVPARYTAAGRRVFR